MPKIYSAASIAPVANPKRLEAEWLISIVSILFFQITLWSPKTSSILKASTSRLCLFCVGDNSQFEYLELFSKICFAKLIAVPLGLSSLCI